jgi:hypothetical protein
MNIHVLSTNYNSGNFCIKNINSVASQTLKPKSHVFIDDVSEKATIETLKKIKETDFYIQAKELYGLDIKINTNKNFKIKNIYEQVKNNMYDDEDIICIVDGDDWLSNRFVLQSVYEKYKKEKLDYLYTNWIYSNENILGCSKKIESDSWDPYKDSWITSHLSTFKVKCFREINQDNFLDENGNWFEMGCDQAYILPILYNSREKFGSYKKIGFIDFPCYVYQHSENTLRKRDGELEIKAHKAASLIRSRGLL